MKIVYFMGERDLPSVRLTARETGTLLAAGRILAQLRELRDDADDDLTTDVALASHTCLEIGTEGVIAQ